MKEKIMEKVFLAIACMSILAVALICFFLFANGLPAIAEIGPLKFLFGFDWAPLNDQYGIAPMIVGSIYVTVGAILIGVPIGILTAIFLVWFCPENIYKVVKPIIDLMAGVPSVVYGFFGMMVLIPMVRNMFTGNGYSVFTASLLLGIMILPTIIGPSESSIRAVPESYYQGALALGASHERSVFFAVLPAAKSGVLAAVVLGIGRAVGETMAVVMVAGNQVRIPDSIFKGTATLTTGIVLEMAEAVDLHRQALIALGVILFVMILLINFVFMLIKNRGND